MKNIRTLSLFSGGGGLDLGFQNAGFEILCSIEFDKPCCKTLEANKGIYFSNYHRVICNDIREIEPEELNLGNIDFIIGGPPCQSFSAAGRRAGGGMRREGYSRHLVWRVLQLYREPETVWILV